MKFKHVLVGALKRMPDHFMVIEGSAKPTVTGTIRTTGPSDLKSRYCYLEIQRQDAGDNAANPQGEYEVVDSWSDE